MPTPTSIDAGYVFVYVCAHTRSVQLYRDTRLSLGYATLALSNDSTCEHMLLNSTHGYEVFAMYPCECARAFAYHLYAYSAAAIAACRCLHVPAVAG